jgi:hypothetical protein
MILGSVMKVRIFILAPHRGQSRGSSLVDAVDELDPPSAQHTPGSRLVGFTVGVGQSGVLRPAGGTNPVGVDTVETDQVFFGLGDVNEGSALGQFEPRRRR